MSTYTMLSAMDARDRALSDADDTIRWQAEQLAAHERAIQAMTTRIAELMARPDESPDQAVSRVAWRFRAIAAEADLTRVTAERDAARSALSDRHQADTREAAETAAAAQAAIAELEADVGRLRPLARAQWQTMSEDARKIVELRNQLADRDVRIAALEAAGPRETSASIAAWADQTFGAPESNMSIFRRAAKEFHELLEKLEIDDNHPHAAAECADVCIVLDRMVHRLGKDMVQERDRKMQINRARTWRVTGDGHGQHVERKEQGS